MARRILLADDSVTAQNMGRRILTDAGYEVLTVNNGSAALKKIAELKPDLVVLDVYMPGYGGLEVCQRVKENPETRQIPVLLTVGKLEPFKGEEARRVGADAFIVKPFEATELLTVLTKLEDKIVAQPQPQKSGRFAKALAAVQQSDSGERFGDKETGWKNRLTIPSPSAKPKQEEEVPEVIPASAHSPEVREVIEQPETAKPVEAQGFERPIPAGLPVDITPEEIAAITAAAASFGGEQTTATNETPAAVSADVAPAEAVEAQAVEVKASAPEVIQEVPAETTVEAVSENVAAEATTAEAHQVQEPQVQDSQVQEPQLPDPQIEASAVVSQLPPAEVNAETVAASETPVSVSAQPSTGDDEVMAAIASLAPTNEHVGSQPWPQGSNGAGHELSASTGAVQIVSGPRWIAEPVEVGAEEMKVALDQEMELALVARASTEAASASAATDAVSSSVVAVATVEPPVAESMPPVVAAEASVVESGLIESSVSESSQVASSVSESAIGESSVVESRVAEPEAVEPAVAEVSAAQEQTSAVAAEESAYAAAASAGAGIEHGASIEGVSGAAAVPENSVATPVESAPQREAELAAAWQNWKQIRESFVSSQAPATIAESPAELNSNHEEAVVPAQSATPEAATELEEVEDAEEVAEEEAENDAPEESTAIASIVDTMLAELRPKLVAEIAKKMSSEKKDKDKKKKK